MKTTIVVKFGVPGFHRWDGAPEGVAYLRQVHRHIFTYRVAVAVNSHNREVEFHTLQAHCSQILGDKYDAMPGAAEGYMFGSRSCEMLAREMGEELQAINIKAVWVECFEDDENGARVEWDQT